MLLSVVGFGTSAAIVKFASVSQLGIYSSFLVVITLAQTCYGSLFSGQMLLISSGKSRIFVNTYFRLTTVMWAASTFGFLLLFFCIFFIMSFFDEETYQKTMAYGTVCVVSLTLFEQTRRLMYVRSEFKYSAVFTIVFSISHVVMSVFLFQLNEGNYSANSAFLSLGTAYLIGVLLNPVFWNSLSTAKNISPIKAIALFKRYLLQGKFALGGIILSWIQNQSITMYLLVFFGPKVAGVFSLGRLLLTPISVVNYGLINGFIPLLRKYAQNKEWSKLFSTTNKFSRMGAASVLAYSIPLLVVLKFDWLQPYLPEIEDAKPFVYFWITLTGILVFRTWLTQYFIARLHFKFLLNASLVSTTITALSVIVLTIFNASPILISSSIIMGELINYFIISKKRNDLVQNLT